MTWVAVLNKQACFLADSMLVGSVDDIWLCVLPSGGADRLEGEAHHAKLGLSCLQDLVVVVVVWSLWQPKMWWQWLLTLSLYLSKMPRWTPGLPWWRPTLTPECWYLVGTLLGMDNSYGLYPLSPSPIGTHGYSKHLICVSAETLSIFLGRNAFFMTCPFIWVSMDSLLSISLDKWRIPSKWVSRVISMDGQT